MAKHLFAVWIACLSAAACGDDQDPKGARELWNEVHALDYRRWERAPGYPVRRPTQAPHSEAVDIFVNDVVAQALRSEQMLCSWPVGALIVKDGWDGDDLELVAVMQKRRDGWYWAEYDGEGDATFSGSPSLCIDCHSRGHDFVRAFELPGSR
jgi:hypothetical protein